MAKPLLSDKLWERIEPLLPPPKPRRFRFPGRKPLDNRKALTGILFVLKTGISWEFLPLEMGCGSGMTCWRRLRDWQAAGVWQQLREVLLAELHAADKIDWSRAAFDCSFARALGGGERTGPSLVDWRKKGSKHHSVTSLFPSTRRSGDVLPNPQNNTNVLICLSIRVIPGGDQRRLSNGSMSFLASL